MYTFRAKAQLVLVATVIPLPHEVPFAAVLEVEAPDEVFAAAFCWASKRRTFASSVACRLRSAAAFCSARASALPWALALPISSWEAPPHPRINEDAAMSPVVTRARIGVGRLNIAGRVPCGRSIRKVRKFKLLPDSSACAGCSETGRKRHGCGSCRGRMHVACRELAAVEGLAAVRCVRAGRGCGHSTQPGVGSSGQTNLRARVARCRT